MKKISPKQITLAQAPQSYIYSTSDLELAVMVQKEDIWLSQKQIAELFQTDVRTISYHIHNLIEMEEITDSTIQEIRIVAEDGKLRSVNHYGLDAIIPIGYRVGSPQATEFRKWANNIIKQYLLVGYAINQKRVGSKSLLRMEDDLTQLERNQLTDRPEYQRLSRVYENKHGAELLFAVIKDVCVNPDYQAIKGLEYKALFNMVAKDLKTALGNDDIRGSLPDVQLQAFTLAELSLRKILETQKHMSNEQVLEAVRIAFAPIGIYLRGIADLTGTHIATGQPLLKGGK